MPPLTSLRLSAAALVVLVLGFPARAQQVVPLLDPTDAAKGWEFNNGAEFPGATGGLTAEPGAAPGGRDALRLTGDFTRGGNYVQAGRKLGTVDVRDIVMTVRSPDLRRLTLRINDAGGQTHQLDLPIVPGPAWQQVVFPLERYFARRGESDAVGGVGKYESWGGAKDGQWHGPATAIYILLGRPDDRAAHSLSLGDVHIVTRPSAVAGAGVKSVIPLDEVTAGKHAWRSSSGEEFPGAKGTFSVVKDPSAAGGTCLQLAGDFTGGGAYVAAIRDLPELANLSGVTIDLKTQTSDATFMTVLLVDGGGQTHKRDGVPLDPDGAWHGVHFDPAKIAGGEHWGGANDGKWHGTVKQLAFHLPAAVGGKPNGPTKKIAVRFSDVRATGLVPVYARPAAFKADFEAAGALDGWTSSGAVAVDGTAAAGGTRSLRLSRTLETVNGRCGITSPQFPAAPGPWLLGAATKADLYSPDNSYSGTVVVECLGAGGAVVERFTVADVFGRKPWQPASVPVTFPAGTTAARFQVAQNKTYGEFRVDDLTAAPLAPAAKADDRIARVVFTTSRLGNLLYPEDPRRFTVSVEAVKPLRAADLTVGYDVRDYWGAGQAKAATAALKPAGERNGRMIYEAAVDLDTVDLDVGRYYELHAVVPAALSETSVAAGREPFRASTSFAILPEAATKKMKPDDVPFTSRCWDNRIPDYFALSDRLGLRTCGVWGGWSAKAPFDPEAPGIDLCRKFGMGVLSGTPAATVEQGETKYDETALREGARRFVERFGITRPLYISLGNEPHGTGDCVLKNVAAYKAVYEAVKKADPTIPVVATAVEPNEEYFKAGYGNSCDVYDFHIYETADDVRRTIKEYQTLMKKYGVVKPIWSTELGLNSQGMTRQVVAADLTKKFATFFAAGGSNASWFGIMYPDPDGKLIGSSGEAHNVFDCRYGRYAPKLDAIAYYNAVNAIAGKKFVAEREMGGVHAVLFRDAAGHALQVLWSVSGRQDVLIPLREVGAVTVVRVDGSRRTLAGDGDGVMVSVTPDPLLLLYEEGRADAPRSRSATPAPIEALPLTYTPASATVSSAAATVARRGPTVLSVTLAGAWAGDIGLIAPPLWSVRKLPAGDNKSVPVVRFAIQPPAGTTAREANLIVTINPGQGSRRGELYVRLPVAD